MKFGAFYGGRRPGGYDNPNTYNEQIEQVLYTDKMGFESAWFSEHHFTPNTISSPLIMSAYVAGLTKNIRVGPAVQLLPFHNPIRVAEETALIDVITNGRLNLGVGKGPRTKIEYWLNNEKTKYDDSSLDYTQSIEIFGEALDIMLAAWKHEKFSYKGTFNDINDIKIWPKPVQKPHPPIYVAAERPSGVKWIAKQGYNMILGGTWFEIEESKKDLDLFKDELKIHGHNYENIDVIYPVIAYVDDTNKIARNLVEKDLDYLIKQMKAFTTFPDNYDWRDILPVGDIDHCTSILKEIKKAGFKHVMIYNSLFSLPHSKLMSSLEKICKYVKPRSE